ncbi:DUF1803 domain-containing protein [Streptococcus loxodontisalivarius]|uniref:DUF1803 domain-containing protein n=1 Tax=Streptococcus loxodontisalivarius TaxID=1349415 RepID=A0ABS2PS75_9STRE|nr:DUF1803 domain-containing protein [Streptococcus loxodontisalivarius]MBM7642405.1 hypothetical protein [Streptococcus loxodontisalivarius]
MIKIFNPDKLTRQPFFQELIAYMTEHDDIILRQIKKDFPEVKHLDRQLETYIQAGYIERKDKRYYLSLPLLTDLSQVSLEEMIFVDTESPIYEELLALRFESETLNQTNVARIFETTNISRDELTLSNYFYKLRTAQPMSQEQDKLYHVLGDVNPEYALKYMTTFLLKYGRKDALMQKRPDIFVKSLEILGYIEKNADDKYELRMDFDQDRLTFRA